MEGASAHTSSFAAFDSILSDSEERRLRARIKELSEKRDKRIHLILSREEVGLSDEVEIKHLPAKVKTNEGFLSARPPNPSPSPGPKF